MIRRLQYIQIIKWLEITCQLRALLLRAGRPWFRFLLLFIFSFWFLTPFFPKYPLPCPYEIHRFLPFLQTARHWSSLLYHQPQIWKKKEDAVAETLKKSWDDYVYFFMFLFCKDCFALCCGCGMLNWKVLARIWNLADRRHRKVEFGSAVTYQREERRGERKKGQLVEDKKRRKKKLAIRLKFIKSNGLKKVSLVENIFNFPILKLYI